MHCPKLHKPTAKTCSGHGPVPTQGVFVQIVSSAIVNAPPPQTFMNLLHKTNRSDVVMKPQTREKMVRIFKGRLTGDKLLAQR